VSRPELLTMTKGRQENNEANTDGRIAWCLVGGQEDEDQEDQEERDGQELCRRRWRRIKGKTENETLYGCDLSWLLPPSMALNRCAQV